MDTCALPLWDAVDGDPEEILTCLSDILPMKRHFDDTPAKRVKIQRKWQGKFDWKASCLYKTYLSNPENNVYGDKSKKTKFKKFIRRFGMDYPSFWALVKLIKSENWFPDIGKSDCIGVEGPPLELLLLGTLRILTRHWTFDDMEDTCGMSEARFHKFFHQFLQVGKSKLFPMFVYPPRIDDELSKSMLPFAQAGFHGAFFVADGTCVWHLQCASNLKIQHTGKEHRTVRRYIISSGYDRRIYSVSGGFPGSWNDQTCQHYDEFLSSMHNNSNSLYGDKTFELFTETGEKIEERGLYGIVDNGFARRQTLICPESCSSNPFVVRASEMLESLRKSSENIIGILKGRWSILQAGVRFRSSTSVDNLFFTCCALNNFRHERDGYSTIDIPLEKVKFTATYLASAPLIFQRIENEHRAAMLSYFQNLALEEKEAQHVTVFEQRRKKLFTHFNYLFIQNKIQWPQLQKRT